MTKTVSTFLVTFALTTVAHAVPVTLQVLAPDGKPIIGAEVRTSRRVDNAAFFAFYDTQAPLREAARTDDKGVAHFDWPAPPEYQNLPATTRKYLASATVWAANFGAINLSLNVGENSVKLPLAGVARGTVRDAKGAPVAGAQMSALAAYMGKSEPDLPGMGMFVMAPGEADFTTLSDAQGRWQIGHLPLGSRATVQLIDPKSAANNALAPVVSATSPITETPLGALDAVDQNGNLRALAGATLSGRVLNPQGAPLSDVMVLVTPSRTSFGPIHYKRARTDAQGNYRLERLEAGNYNLSLSPPHTSSSVADPGAAAEITLQSGETQKVRDQNLVESGTIEVQINDAISGKPLPNFSVNVQPQTGFRAMLLYSIGGKTDQAGKVTIKAAPGKVRVRLEEMFTGYVDPSSNGTSREPVTVVAGQTQRIEWKLERGLSVGGRVVDTKGKIVPEVGIYYGRIGADGQSHNLTGVMSDEAGKWDAQGFQPGHYALSLYQSDENQSPQWELVTPKTFIVPVRDALDIVVKPLAQTTLSGRVVDALGAGVAGAKIDAKITIPGLTNRPFLQSAAVSEANGNYTLPAFATTAKTVALSVERAGYVLQKAPEATQKNAQWSASDGVLQALSSQLSGRVVDANNAPQKGVQVLAARSGSVTTSDENGAWSFDNIAPDENEIVAVGAGGAAVESGAVGRDAMNLKLQAMVPATARDIAGARELLEDAWQTSRGAEFYERESFLATLAPFDPDAALEIARGADQKASDRAIVAIVEAIARADAEKAREWAPQVLAGLEEPESQLNATVIMAQALWATHPDEATLWLQKSKVVFETAKEPWQKRAAAASIATLSAQLQQADAPQWFERALQLAAQKAEGARNYRDLAWQAAEVNEDWARRVVEAAVKSAPDQPTYAPGSEVVISAAIRRLARWNLPAAQKLFDKYDAPEGDAMVRYEMGRAQNALLMGRLRQNGDVDAARKSARASGETQRSALMLVAKNAPPAQRTEILREVLQLARADGFQPLLAIGVAGQLLPLDREVAKNALDEIGESFHSDGKREGFLRSKEVAQWAYAYRTIDPTRARWELEREWARQRNRTEIGPNDRWTRGFDLRDLVLAMGTLDEARARAMIFALPVNDNENATFYAARILARWLLADENERQSRSLSDWSRSARDGIDSD